MKTYYNKKLREVVHYCGDGFKGVVKKKSLTVKNIFGEVLIERDVNFCTFCGEEF